MCTKQRNYVLSLKTVKPSLFRKFERINLSGNGEIMKNEKVAAEDFHNFGGIL